MNNKTEKKISFKKEKKNPRKHNEPFKPRQRSQICNPVNPRLRLHQEFQFLTNLILIKQSKSIKKQQLKNPRKPSSFLK